MCLELLTFELKAQSNTYARSMLSAHRISGVAGLCVPTAYCGGEDLHDSFQRPPAATLRIWQLQPCLLSPVKTMPLPSTQPAPFLDINGTYGQGWDLELKQLAEAVDAPLVPR